MIFSVTFTTYDHKAVLLKQTGYTLFGSCFYAFSCQT